jgi:hypothetical protein
MGSLLVGKSVSDCAFLQPLVKNKMIKREKKDAKFLCKTIVTVY